MHSLSLNSLMKDGPGSLHYDFNNFSGTSAISHCLLWWGINKLFFNYCAGSSVESIIDSILKSLPEYLLKHGEEYHIKSVERIVRSCPFNLEELLILGDINYTAEICVNITNMKVTVGCSRSN